MPASATKAPASKPATSKTADLVIDLGSSSISPAGAHGPASPAGTLHLVDGWEPLCGSERVRFVFPGRPTDGVEACPACVKASMPKPRSAPRSRARAS